MGTEVIVIGAGVAGLGSAIRLRAAGWEVTVLEANSYPGGKLSSLQLGAFRFDAGPSLFTLPELVLDLFKVAGQSPEGRFSYRSKTVGCHYFFPDGTFLRGFTEPTALAAEVEQALGVPQERTLAYLRHAAHCYELVGRLFLENPLDAWSTWVNSRVFNAVMHAGSLDLSSTLHEANLRRLKEPRLVQYFDRMATYNGSSPYRAPGLLAMIPHLEHNVGTFVPDGGMISITRNLHRLAEDLGVRFEFETRVNQILVQGKRVRGVSTASGPRMADLVVCNMDVVSAYRQLLADQPAPERLFTQERSSSALIFYLGMGKRFPKLDLHNVFFTSDYAAEFRALFEDKTIAEEPTIYLNVTAKDVPADAPAGCENWFVMVNAPANVGQDWDSLIARVRRSVLNQLERQLGEPLEPHIVVEQVLDPRGIEARTSSHQGALYGASSNSRWAAFLRHQNASSTIGGLYFCGGTVHPGGGIPLCLLSAKITCERIARDCG